MNNKQKLLAILLLVFFTTAALADFEQGAFKDKSSIFKFDVVENASRFIFDDAPLFDDGYPAYGNSFVTQGYIYPYGFLEEHEGVFANGEPAYPEKVIGVWTCRGFFIGDGAHTTTGPMVITTQTYDFFDKPGYQSGQYSTDRLIISEGYELADINRQFSRPVTGGTGQFSRIKGEALQTLMGFNPYMGVRLRFVIKATSVN